MERKGTIRGESTFFIFFIKCKKPEAAYDWRKAIDDATTMGEILVIWERLFGGQVKAVINAKLDSWSANVERFVAAQMQSVDYTPDPQQLERWQRLGLVAPDVTPATFASSIPAEMHLLRYAFIIGRIAEAVERGGTFEQVMATALTMPLKKPDLAAIAVAEQQTANYIRNFA